MIFGLIDYVNYRLKRGHYSAPALTADGWKLATPENFLGANEAPPATIFVLHTRTSLIAWLVMYGTNSVASHTGIQVGRGHVVDMTLGGVILHEYADYLNGKSWIKDLRKMPIPPEKRAAVVDEALKKVGKVKFGWATVAIMAWWEATGTHYSRPPNCRLEADCLVCLTLPALLHLIRHRRVPLRHLLAPVAYVVMWGKSRLMRWARARVRALETNEHRLRSLLI